MYFVNMKAIIYIASITISFTTAATIYPDEVGGSLLNSGRLLVLSPTTIKDL